MKLRSLIPCLTIALILAGGISACKDDPTAPKPGGKDSCDTCAVDTNDTVIVVDPNDTTSHDFVWTEYNLPGEASINGCWVFDDTTIWIAGRDLYRYSASHWERITIVGSGATIFGFTPKDSWFVYGGIPFHFDGMTSIDYRLHEDGTGLLNYSQDGGLRAAWGTSSNDMFFVGDKGTIVHFDGTNWMKFPKVTEKHLTSISGRSSKDVWAAGWNSSTALSVLLHYDGSSWTEIDVNTIGWIGLAKHGMGSVWVTDSAGHRVVNTAGSLVWRKTDDGPWRQDSADLKNGFGDGTFAGIGLIGNNANDMFGAGSFGYVAHWNGKTWHRYDQFWKPGGFGGVSTGSIKGNTVCLAGVDGGSWIAIGRRGK